MSEFTDSLHEVFRTFGEISARRMFGGHGIYHQGLMFALVADEVLYLKTDTESRPQFEALGLAPFVFEKQGKPTAMAYLAAPDLIYDDADEAQRWAGIAYAAALRAAAKARKR